MALYLRAFPNEATNLIFYSLSIKKLMKKGANWRNYDHDFREQKGFWHYAWTTPRADLTQQALASIPSFSGPSRQSNPRFQGGPGSGPASEIPAGYCFAYYHKDKTCNDAEACPYSHKCPIRACRRSHPGYLHPRNSGQRKPSNQSARTNPPTQN